MQFLFEDHVLDIDRHELRRGAQQIAVGPQVFDLLVYLVQNRERVVTKDDLLDAIWSGRFVSESNLTTRINAARKAIGDTGEEQRLIRTVPRKGFRFVGVVTCQAENVKDVPGSTATTPKPLPLPDKPSTVSVNAAPFHLQMPALSRMINDVSGTTPLAVPPCTAMGPDFTWMLPVKSWTVLPPVVK